ncbi:MAG: 2-C-methyl-D-erythritol 4-phosphate cytidylyltransferase [Planctomycetes bacterium]|nr:2-C-methyl-D-erythritol 4-phosphate cytidylyltransferase [Planctomycetota bacterium]
MAKISVIVASAGKADRFGGAEKKTLAKIDGRPVFLRSIEHFINRADVCQTILAVAPEDMGEIKSRYAPNLGFMGVTIVEGGATRVDTVATSLDVVIEEAEYVAVHDAARPCVTEQWITAVFADAVKTGASILAAPLFGTIKRVAESGVIDATLPREALFEAQTPQVFRKDLLVGCYGRRGEFTEEITDDAQLVELCGHPVSVVKTDATNLKITVKGDLALANAIIKARPVVKRPKLGAFEEAQW